jgi:hypothetical protein
MYIQITLNGSSKYNVKYNSPSTVDADNPNQFSDPVDMVKDLIPNIKNILIFNDS